MKSPKYLNSLLGHRKRKNSQWGWHSTCEKALRLSNNAGFTLCDNITAICYIWPISSTPNRHHHIRSIFKCQNISLYEVVGKLSKHIMFCASGSCASSRFASLFENMFFAALVHIFFRVSQHLHLHSYAGGESRCTPSCSCFEDNTAYFGNNVVFGKSNPKPSREECVSSCQYHPQCKFWTWDKISGSCYLKHSKSSNFPTGNTRYVSGPKHCVPSS